MSDIITITRDDRSIRFGAKHQIYRQDIEKNFNYYFSAVDYIMENGIKVVDYSKPALHKVKGFDLFPVFFPFTAEPIDTTQQYLDFAELKEGSVVIDMGAYSGLTAILFKQAVGSSGRVVAVEADEDNFEAVKINVAKFHQETNTDIDFIYAAAWNHCDGLEFASDGAMGSSAKQLTWEGRGQVKVVPSVTLSRLVELFNLDKVDFIKCDIEGAERVVFDDAAFFEKFKPRIIVELHGGARVACVASLEKIGYTCVEVKQEGSEFPLLECVYENSSTRG